MKVFLGLRGVASVLPRFSQALLLGVALVSLPVVATAATVPLNNTKVTTKSEVFPDKRVLPMLTQDSAAQMERLASRYRAIVQDGGWPKVPNGSYKKGKKGKGIAALNMRLFVEGYLRPEATQGEFESVFTSATEDAVRRFQRNHGLEISGKVEKSTLQALNVSAATRLATIEANIERLRTYAEGLGNRYVVVNVPSQQIEAVSNGRVNSRHNAVVGRPDRPTPVVATALSDVIFNPYWNAPASIIERDLIPKILSGVDVFSEMNIKVFQGFGGPEIDPQSVDWETAVADDYHFRQEPGETNAMATAKINFPSPFGIYLHDTPDKQYFKTGQRYYSSGCVRVEKVDVLLNWILNGQDGIGTSQIAALAETQENTEVKLMEPPQLRVTYLTAFPVGETVAFHDDVYELDGTGFVVGQPLPVGETSEEGLRFVLKPIPRKASAVDAAEADGFTLQGSSKPKLKAKKKSSGGGLYESDFVDDADIEEPVAATKKPAKIKPAPKLDDEAALVTAPVKAKNAAKPVVAAKPKAAKAVPAKKKTPGLFDWAAYRKQQALAAKNNPSAAKPAKKKPATTAVTCKPDKDGKLPQGCKPIKTANQQKKP